MKPADRAAVGDAVIAEVSPQCLDGVRIPLARNEPQRARVLEVRYSEVADPRIQVHHHLPHAWQSSLNSRDPMSRRCGSANSARPTHRGHSLTHSLMHDRYNGRGTVHMALHGKAASTAAPTCAADD